MTLVGYQLQFHQAIPHEHYDLGHLLRQLRYHLPQTPRSHQSTLTAAEARAKFEIAYDHLTPAAAQLLRSLSLLLKGGFSSAIASVLLDCEIDVADQVLQELITLNLVDPLGQTWYCFAHEVIRQQARSRLVFEELLEARQQARLRVSRWYLELCEQMSLCLDPATRFQIALAARKGDSFVASLSSAWSETNRGAKRFENIAQSLFLFALDWFESERDNLLAVVEWTYQAKAWDLVVQLTRCLVRFFDVKADWQGWEQTHLLAFDAAQMLNDRTQTAQILNSLGNAFVHQADWDRAQTRYDRALTFCHEQGLIAEEAQTLINLGIVAQFQNRADAALGYWNAAIERFPSGSLERQKVSKWMQSPTRLPLLTALEELGTSANSHQILNAVGGAIKWLLHPGGLHRLL